MNLTSKRLLSFIAGCAGVCVLSATAATSWVEDSFEDGSDGLIISQYKQDVQSSGVEGIDITNYVWVAADGDYSALVATNYTYEGATRPMTNGTPSQLVLNLQTEGQTLVRQWGATNNFSVDGPIYVDTLIKFTPSEDDPTISDSSVKAAVFVNIQSNLCIYHGSESSGSTNTDVNIYIDPEKWYRLTIVLKSMNEQYAGFKVYIDGVAITNEAAIDDAWTPGGSWFYSAAVDTTLSAVAFQGTGMIDELVVTDEANGLSESSGILLTLSFNSSLVSVVQDGNPVSDGGTVVSGSTIVIDANDWYEIASVTGSGDAVYSGLPIPGSQVNCSTGTVSATASETITITAQQYTGPINTGYGSSVDGGKLSTWALANNKSESDVIANAESWSDDYLLNVAPDTNAKLEISNIAVSNATAYVTVITTDASGNITNLLSGINGTLKYYAATNLVTGFEEKDTISVQGVSSSVTVGIPSTEGSFFKVKLQ